MSSSRLLININNLKDNYNYLHNLSSPKVLTGAVVKSDAYGLGSQEIVTVLNKLGCQYFFCARLEEGMQIRRILKNALVIVFEGPQQNNFSEYKHFKIIPVINSIEQLNVLVENLKNCHIKIPIVLNFDTGMNRLGFGNDCHNLIDLESVLIKNLNILFIMSHLSCSEIPNSKHNYDQLNLFKKICSKFNGIPASFANTGGILLGKDFHFDITRPGIGLYGFNPNGKRDLNLRNVIILEADIIQLRMIKKGEFVGYGANFKAKNKMKLATIGIGYADGYNRSLENKAVVTVGDYKVPIVGRISMDLTVIDVTKVPLGILNKIKTVCLIGKHYTVNDMANDLETISWEILTKFGNRVRRIYIKN